MLKMRRSRDRLIFNMGIPEAGKDGLYTETGSGPRVSLSHSVLTDMCPNAFDIRDEATVF